MRCIRFPALIAALLTSLQAQSFRIQIFSEFQRVDPFGQVIAIDHPEKIREVLSPGILRNGFASFHVAATTPPRESYFLFVQTFPPEIFDWKLYEQKFVEAEGKWIPDRLQEIRRPFFGAMPDPGSGIAGQTTRVYLLDVRVPRDLQSQPARLEMLMKTGIWSVSPMEIRIMPGTHADPMPGENLCPTQPADSLSEIPHCMVQAYLDGKIPSPPSQIETVRDVIARNIAQDLALARKLDPARVEKQMRELLPEQKHARFDWYLSLRSFLFREASR